MPTWNHVTAHLDGTPQLLEPEVHDPVLCWLTDHFAARSAGGRSMLDDKTATRRAAKGTTGRRLPVARLETRARPSQNTTPETVSTIIEQLAKDNPASAQEMRREHHSSPVPRGGP